MERAALRAFAAESNYYPHVFPRVYKCTEVKKGMRLHSATTLLGLSLSQSERESIVAHDKTRSDFRSLFAALRENLVSVVVVAKRTHDFFYTENFACVTLFLQFAIDRIYLSRAFPEWREYDAIIYPRSALRIDDHFPFLRGSSMPPALSGAYICPFCGGDVHTHTCTQVAE